MPTRLERCQAAGKAGAMWAASALDQAALHLNVYRAATYRLHWLRADDAGLSWSLNFDNGMLRDFARHDQDLARTPLQRKKDLATICRYSTSGIHKALELGAAQPIKNRRVLHQLARTRLLIFGDKSAAESLSYARRASRKLHPDRIYDLHNWMSPGTILWPHPEPRPNPEHARDGAQTLFELHNRLKAVILQPYYQKALWDKKILLGGTLTLGHLAVDLAAVSLASVAIALMRKKSIAVILKLTLGGYIALAAVAIGRHYAARRRARERANNLAVVLYTGRGATQ